MSCPTISSPSTEVAIGENVTLKCSSETGSLPINYTLYKGIDRVLPPASKNKKGEEAAFHFTINSISELGEYKCKAENKFNKNKYSLGFNFTLREPVSQPMVNCSSTEVRIGENVTLSCFSRTGSLPITYTLYRGKERVQPPASKNKSGEAAEFHFPINSISGLGEYKCKAENFSKGKYSLGFNFTMRGEDNNLAVFVVPPLLLLLLAVVLAVPLLILPRCKTRKLRDISPTGFVPTSYPGSENDVTYAEIAHEEVQEEYVNLEFSNEKEKVRKVSLRDATTVAYSEVIIR
ncbi:PREDICTED: allergin-1 [Gekko japonicus]|uniref:Allergin-1 n=1 Tax=Gekko japonicus TaxID=146911 RepID=A0ABM1KZK7_GEKJA|nr:PREDICTED: allergin-1 [Gekko japonicus]